MSLDCSAPVGQTGIGEVLDFAIAKEEAAAERYLALAERAGDPTVKAAFLAMSDQERGHRARLEAIAAGDLTAFNVNRLDAAPVTEAATVSEPGPDASLTQVLLFAVNAEHEAFQLYMSLARATTDPGLATLFRTLATEEQGHHVHLERLYRTVAFGDA